MRSAAHAVDPRPGPQRAVGVVAPRIPTGTRHRRRARPAGRHTHREPTGFARAPDHALRRRTLGRDRQRKSQRHVRRRPPHVVRRDHRRPDHQHRRTRRPTNDIRRRTDRQGHRATHPGVPTASSLPCPRASRRSCTRTEIDTSAPPSDRPRYDLGRPYPRQRHRRHRRPGLTPSRHARADKRCHGNP